MARPRHPFLIAALAAGALALAGAAHAQSTPEGMPQVLPPIQPGTAPAEKIAPTEPAPERPDDLPRAQAPVPPDRPAEGAGSGEAANEASGETATPEATGSTIEQPGILARPSPSEAWIKGKGESTVQRPPSGSASGGIPDVPPQR